MKTLNNDVAVTRMKLSSGRLLLNFASGTVSSQTLGVVIHDWVGAGREVVKESGLL